VSLLDTKRKRDIKAQRGQFLAVSVTIALGVLLFASSYDAYRNLDGSYNQTSDRLSFANVTVVGVDAELANPATAIEGVAAADARVQAVLPMGVSAVNNFLGRVIAYPADGQPVVNQIDVIDGA
jgi:putative ABC transport system permease protein